MFDGNGSGRSTKDDIHQKRTGSDMGVDVDITLSIYLYVAQNEEKAIFGKHKQQTEIPSSPRIWDGEG